MSMRLTLTIDETVSQLMGSNAVPANRLKSKLFQ